MWYSNQPNTVLPQVSCSLIFSSWDCWTGAEQITGEFVMCFSSYFPIPPPQTNPAYMSSASSLVSSYSLVLKSLNSTLVYCQINNSSHISLVPNHSKWLFILCKYPMSLSSWKLYCLVSWIHKDNGLGQI